MKVEEKNGDSRGSGERWTDHKEEEEEEERLGYWRSGRRGGGGSWAGARCGRVGCGGTEGGAGGQGRARPRLSGHAS